MSDERLKKISTVTLWGAAANLALSAAKMAAGIVGRSSAMVADAVHSLSDLISDFVVIVMVRVSAKEQDESHDYGHGKFEPLATAIISFILAIVGIEMMVKGIRKILAIVSGEQVIAPGMIALWAALLSIAVKEALFQWNMRVGRKVDSSAMIANAWHHRSDALSSVGSAAGIAGAIFLGGKWIILDPLTGCVISIFIIVIAVRMSIPAFKELTDASLPADTEKIISDTIMSVDGVDNVHDLKTRKSGKDSVIAAHIVVNPGMSVRQAHDITVIAEKELKKEFGPDTLVSLHIEPNVDSD